METIELHESITDVEGIKVGHWSNLDAATGCTVVLCESGAIGGADVRGGAPGTRETDLLRPGMLVRTVNAVLLTGGSTFGLDAAAGVMRWCEERGHGLSFASFTIPIVAGAVIFDLSVGDGSVRPNADSGYAACEAATDARPQEGSVGAGTGASVAKALGMRLAVKGGIGTTSEATPSGIVVGAIVAVNAMGEVFDSNTGRVVAGPRDPAGGFVSTIDVLRNVALPPTPTNTTIGVVATNARLNKEQANRLATVSHDGIARAIRPAHTLADGDAMFSLATGTHPHEPEPADIRAIEVLAALATERAIRNAVLAATTIASVPAVRDLT